MEVDHAKHSQALIETVEVKSDKDSDAPLSRSSLVQNSAAAVMLINWLVDISSVDQQRRVSDAVYQLCMTSCWNAMQCSKAGMISSVVHCLQQSSSATLHVSVVGELCSFTASLPSRAVEY